MAFVLFPLRRPVVATISTTFCFYHNWDWNRFHDYFYFEKPTAPEPNMHTEYRLLVAAGKAEKQKILKGLHA